jgi:hypothetical protein
MRISNSGNGIDYDFTAQQSSSSGLSQSIINIIEANTNTQTNINVGYTHIQWENKLPILVEKYTDAAKTIKLYTIAITFVTKKPTVITIINHDDNITTQILFEYVGRFLIGISKTVT